MEMTPSRYLRQRHTWSGEKGQGIVFTRFLRFHGIWKLCIGFFLFCSLPVLRCLTESFLFNNSSFHPGSADHFRTNTGNFTLSDVNMFDSEGGFVRVHSDDRINFTGSLPRDPSNSDYKTSVSIWVHTLGFTNAYNLFCLPFKSHYNDSTGTAADRDIGCCARIEETGGRRIITFSCYLNDTNKFTRQINITDGNNPGGWDV
ncbi:unnamed protein product [Moneuplotes crassus]|uniref:Uncharacterized protein n=1 Tax=Euplotes crassus TaxID=5936 RepID=A0AAD1U6F4_EUPCR|nr:unnamed protein product [Moneuplotes crassus]